MSIYIGPSLVSIHINPRSLRKAIEKNLPPSVKEDHEFIPGGDIRIQGNSWIRKSFIEAQLSRVPRETEVRKVIFLVSKAHDLCILAYTMRYVKIESITCGITIARSALASLGPYSRKEDRISWIREQVPQLNGLSVSLIMQHCHTSYHMLAIFVLSLLRLGDATR